MGERREAALTLCSTWRCNEAARGSWVTLPPRVWQTIHLPSPLSREFSLPGCRSRDRQTDLLGYVSAGRGQDAEQNGLEADTRVNKLNQSQTKRPGQEPTACSLPRLQRGGESDTKSNGQPKQSHFPGSPLKPERPLKACSRFLQ